MGGDDHPFSGYNKKDIHTALVGNWVEERALEADTGIFRYQVRYVGERGEGLGVPGRDRLRLDGACIFFFLDCWGANAKEGHERECGAKSIHHTTND
jgi:hypothetical protein